MTPIQKLMRLRAIERELACPVNTEGCRHTLETERKTILASIHEIPAHLEPGKRPEEWAGALARVYGLESEESTIDAWFTKAMVGAGAPRGFREMLDLLLLISASCDRGLIHCHGTFTIYQDRGPAALYTFKDAVDAVVALAQSGEG